MFTNFFLLILILRELDDDLQNINPSSSTTNTPYLQQNNSSSNHNGHSIFGNDDYNKPIIPPPLRKRRYSQAITNDDYDSMPHYPHNLPVLPEVTTSETRDQHTIFGEYVAEVLRKLPKKLIPQTTLNVMRVLIEAQERVLVLQQPSEQNTSQGNDNGVAVASDH